jgi:predicted ATPase/class 3 adenylate cyclase
MQCGRCGSPQRPGGWFCTDCGARLGAACPGCGADVAADQRFCGQCGTRLETHTPSPAAGRASAVGAGPGERRHLTVLFADLVGSTRLATQLDAEDYHHLITAYHRAAGEVIRRADGVIAKFIGDGIFACFGFPRAHEDDAEQAVRAALGIAEAVRALAADRRGLDVRVGVATGMVVVGETVGENGYAEVGVFGETSNLVARLQELAPPGRVVVCATTRRLIANHFACSAPELRPLKGYPAPVPVALVERDHGGGGRFGARHATDLPPLVGRGEEVELLVRRWRTAAAGEGRVALLVGEPGIGKSRIALALREAVAEQPHACVRIDGSAHHANSALFPFVAHLERAANLQRGDGAETRLGKLRAALRAGEDDPDVDAVAALLGLTSPAAPAGSAAERKARTFEALVAILARLSERVPVLLLVEDAHWLDPTSLELLALIVDRAAGLRLLVVVTARPEFVPPWPSHAHVSTTALNRLDRREGAALVAQVAGRDLPDDVLASILARTDGVPLFVEELTKTVLESGMLGEADGRYVLERPLETLAIPDTLQASLFARLDRLSAAREVAQIGAAVGRSFPYELLAEVAPLGPGPLATALAELEAAELVFRRGRVPDAVFTFKHALVRDAAYASLLKSKRRVLHGAIAEALERRFAELVAAEPETLAHHLGEAGDLAAAAPRWLEAGRNAAARSANLEAIAHLERGLEAVRALAAGRERDRLEFDHLFALGPCYIATRGPAAAEAVATFEAARSAAERLGEPPELRQVMFWIATASVIRGELAKADDAVRDILRVAAPEGGPALLNALRGRAMILLFMGRLSEARATIERFLAVFDASSPEDQLAARAAGQDARAAGSALSSWTLWLAGEREAAFAASREALARADAVDHPHSRAYVAYYAAVLAALEGALDDADAHARRCLELCDAHGFEQWRGLARAVIGICDLQRRPAARGESLAVVTDALADYQRMGYQLGTTALYVVLAPALLDAGFAQRAGELIDAGLATAERNDERIFEAELHRLGAHWRRATAPDGGEADVPARLQRAVDVARAQGARRLERRAARDLVRWRARRGSAPEVDHPHRVERT